MQFTNPLLQSSILTTLLVSTASAVSGAVVYDNTTNVLPGSAFRTGMEYGDEIKLAGTDRLVTSITIGYFGDFPAGTVASGRVRIYENNGSDAIDGPQVALRPQSLLWESPLFPLAANNQAVTFSPNVTVPDSVTWTIDFDGLGNVVGNGAALSISNPVSVGGTLGGGVIGSFNDFWIKTGTTDDSWALNRLAGGTVPANFYATVTAVPEPSVVALGVLGLVGLWAVRQRVPGR